MPLSNDTIIHADLAGANLHTVFRRVFADTAARIADSETYKAAEVNNAYALVVSNDNGGPQVYLLTDHATPTWSAMDSGAILQLADDAALAGLAPSLTVAYENKFLLVRDRSSQGPQLLYVSGGQAQSLIGLPATVTIAAVDPSGIAVAVPTGTDLNLAEEIGASIRNEFPTGAWDFTDSELTTPASGYIRAALSIRFSVSGPSVVDFGIQEWTGASWLDVAETLAQDVSPQTIPYHLTGFDELLVTEGKKYRLVIRHDAASTRTITVYKAIWITNFVFAA